MEINRVMRERWEAVERTVEVNTGRVLEAFRLSGLSSPDLLGTTGYGYDDRGRALLDRIVAQIFGTESAILRAQWASGTHALATSLRALLRPGSRLWIASGPVYDTLQPMLSELRELGVVVTQLGLSEEGFPEWPAPEPKLAPDVVYVQRSRGYSGRASWGASTLVPVIEKAHRHGAYVLVDNCYGEFTGPEEPGHWGADVVVGSLMKNPGGGIAPTGAYVAGSASLVRRVADTLYAPGIGLEVGATSPYQRLMAQGLFLAPQMVGEALMGGLYVGQRFADQGYDVHPRPDDLDRNDIVTAIELGEASRVIRFCQAIQAWSPVDASALPEPWEMPGYPHPVIMAAGGFVSGASLELSADAPMRPPFRVYLQGGLSRWHTMLAGEAALSAVISKSASTPPHAQ